MLALDRAQLFDRLAGTLHLREWLDGERAKAVIILIHSTDVEQMRIAQGRAQLLDEISGLLEHALAQRGIPHRQAAVPGEF